MVFLSGPCQVGKSWLSKELQKIAQRPRYLNYDSVEDRQVIVSAGWSTQTDLLILDEIHKMPQWKNFLKGVWDTRPEGSGPLCFAWRFSRALVQQTTPPR